jgi:hypothetical protein
MFAARTKNFPLNTEFETTITFVTRDVTPGNLVASVAPAADAVTLRMHHSFVQLPDAIISQGHLMPAPVVFHFRISTTAPRLLNPSISI